MLYLTVYVTLTRIALTNYWFIILLFIAGIYDEQFEMSSKIPFELVGHGPPGSVILVISVEQNAMTGRLCNLYIKAPWFTTHVIKVKEY